MKRLTLLAASLLLLAACQPKEQTLQASIKSMEQKMAQSTEMDTVLAKNITNAYLRYAKLHPKDSLAPVYISHAADVYKEMPGEAVRAINTYNRIIHEYPDNPLAERATFMIGFVFDEKLHDRNRAIQSYRYFLKTYPESPLVEDATNLLALQTDSLSEEQMVDKWIKESENKTKKQQ